MNDEKQVVNLNEEPAPQIDRTPVEAVVETPAEQPQPEATPVVEPAPIPAVPAANLDVDEFGVPWKNRAMEWKRKSEEVIEKLPQMIEEKLQKVTQPQTPTYTYEQLEVYKQQNQNDPNIVAWVVGEQRKIQTTEQRKLIEEVVGGREQAIKVERVREDAVKYVQKEYPEAFRKDANGNLAGWNEASPLFQHISSLMRDPRLANDPQGLAAAADIAYGRVMRSQAPVLQQKVEQAKADVKQAQKASMTEGSGRRVTVSASPQSGAIENLRKTGSMKDAEAAIGAILRNRGFLEQ
jgi:hypothetical protein